MAEDRLAGTLDRHDARSANPAKASDMDAENRDIEA